jgi:biopolymer transport protein ExbB/TolQ
MAVSMAAGVGLVAILHFTLSEGAAIFLLDRGGFGYPFSVQNCSWIVFAAAIGELWVRSKAAAREQEQLLLGLLPEDPSTVLHATNLGALYERTQQGAPDCFLPRVIRRVILQCQTTRSVDQASALLNALLDLHMHEIDLRYNGLRYIMWLIPSLGFLGTVLGIALALNFAGDPAEAQNPRLLTEVTNRLAVAFNTTLLALIMSSLVVLGTNIIQEREERALNLAGQYCFDNLINRLFLR